MTTRLILSEKSEFYDRLARVEELCLELDISIESFGNTEVVDRRTGDRFSVGRQEDRESFPRSIDVPFYLISEE